jgi:hypothetical protein
VKINWRIGGTEKMKNIYSEIQKLEIFKYLIRQRGKVQKEISEGIRNAGNFYQFGRNILRRCET